MGFSPLEYLRARSRDAAYALADPLWRLVRWKPTLSCDSSERQLSSPKQPPMAQAGPIDQGLLGKPPVPVEPAGDTEEKLIQSPPRYDFAKEIPDVYPANWDYIVSIGDNFPALLLTKSIARTMARAVRGDRDILRLETAHGLAVRDLDNQFLILDGEVKELEGKLDEEKRERPENNSCIDRIADELDVLDEKIRQVGLAQIAARYDIFDQKDDQYLLFRNVLKEVGKYFEHSGILAAPNINWIVDQTRLPVMFRGDYTSRRKTLIQAWRERWPRPRADKDAVNAWRKAHPAPSETLNPTQRKKEAGNETEAWRVLRLDKIAALEEFLRMEDAALFRERKHKLDKAAGQLVPSKEAFDASELREKIRIFRNYIRIEKEYRNATILLRAKGQHPSTVDSTHISEPITDIDIGDTGSLQKDPAFRAKIAEWNASASPGEDGDVQKVYIWEDGRYRERPQLYPWDSGPEIQWETISQLAQGVEAMKIRAWENIKRKRVEGAIDAVSGQRKRLTSSRDGSGNGTAKRRLGRERMIAWPCSPGSPVYDSAL